MSEAQWTEGAIEITPEELGRFLVSGASAPKTHNINAPSPTKLTDEILAKLPAPARHDYQYAVEIGNPAKIRYRYKERTE